MVFNGAFEVAGGLLESAVSKECAMVLAVEVCVGSCTLAVSCHHSGGSHLDRFEVAVGSGKNVEADVHFDMCDR